MLPGKDSTSDGLSLCSLWLKDFQLAEQITTTLVPFWLKWNFSVPLLSGIMMKWKHFPRYWPFVRGIHRSPVNSPHKGRWRRALMFSLICTRINSWVNNGEAGELRRHRAHRDVIVMVAKISAVKKRQTFWRKRTNVFFEVDSSYNPDKLICILL